MFLSIRKIRNQRYLYLLETVPGKKKGTHTNRIVKNLGNFDKLPEEVRNAYLDKKAKRELAKSFELKLREKDISSAVDTVAKTDAAPTRISNFNRLFPLNYGHLALKPLWEKDLGLKYKIEYLQKSSTEIKTWRLNDLLFYLCALKLIDPKSYFSASNSKSNFLYCPWNNVVQDNFYRALDFVYDHRESLIKHAVKSRLEQTKGQIKVAFFDCTNTWFETPYDDITWQVIRYTRKTTLRLRDQSLSNEEIQAYLESNEFLENLTDELELNKEDVLRMRGRSKESRFAQPIVTVALAIDQTGFPIDCKVYAGNIAEIHTVEQMIESLKKKYSVKDIYFVADKGLNSGQKLEKIQEEKLGFVVAQKINAQQEKFEKEMLDLTGYRNYIVDDSGMFRVKSEGSVDKDKARFKVCDHVKKFYVEIEGTTKSGNPKKEHRFINCKIVYTFSPARRERELKDLEMQISKAAKAVSDGYLAGNPYKSGWRALLQTNKEAAQTPEEKEQYRAVGLKQDIIEERRRNAGYAALVFSHPKDKDAAALTDEEVLTTYHRLVGIEDCFRVMKSSFSIRPVHVRLKEHIVAHCYLCVLSLMLMRLVQEKLEAKKYTCSAEKITHALAQALVLPTPSSDGMPQMWLNMGLDPQFHRPEFTGKKKARLSQNALEDHGYVWHTYEKHREETPFAVDQILEAVGLNKLPLYGSTGEIKRILGIHSVTEENMLAPEYLENYRRVVNNNLRS